VIFDPTETEKALADHAALLERAQDAGGVGSWLWRPGEGRTSWSEQAVQIYGFTPDEVATGAPDLFLSVVHPDDVQQVLEAVEASLASTEPTEVEYRIVRRDDRSIRWVRDQATVDRDAAGTPTRMVGAVADITEQKLAELDALRKTALLARAHQLAGIGTYVIDLERKTILVSAELARLLRAGDREFEVPLDDYRSRFYIPARLEAATERFEKQYAAGDETVVAEGMLVRADGELIWVRSVENRSEGLGDRFMLGVTQDVTLQKQTEVELRETAAGLERAQQLGRVGTWTWYPVEDESEWSQGALEMLGHPPGTTGRDLLMAVLHPDDAKDQERRAREAFRTATRYADEFRIVRNGETRWLHAQGAIEFDETGTPLRMVGVLMDITDRRLADQERHELEERLRQSQKLDALGQLAGGVAHDFNNLLTVISGGAALALMDEQLSDETRGNVDEVVHAARRASELTQKLLVFARRQPAEMRALDLNDVVTDSRKLLERLIGSSIQVAESLSPDDLPVVADLGQLEQVLLNLALNARDAMPDGGRLTISTVREGRYGVICVQDTGSGIAPESLERIFEPFFTTKEAGKGTGLGLATAYGIVDAAGGEITVETDLGAGSTFSVRLPLDLSAPSGLRGTHAETAVLVERPLHALLVDDDDHVRGTLTRLLRAAGCSNVVSVGSGVEALALIDSGSELDVLVTDLMMPHMSGIELARDARARLPELPVLFISGSSENASLAAAQPNGLFLAKPVGVEQVAAALTRLVPA
jgi:PAS domain S-box-containing protein